MTMASLIPSAQVFKVAAGLAQVAFALWVVIRRPTTVNGAFALSFGANGIAYSILNLVRPGLRTPHSFALEGWGLSNWIAALAMLLFGVLFLKMLQQSKSKLLILPVSMALAMLASDTLTARAYHMDLLAFGGLAIYPATAFVLALFALIFATESPVQVRNRRAAFSAALAINSVDHIGASVIRPDRQYPGDVLVQLAGMLIILGVWVWNSRAWGSESSRMALVVVLCIIAAFLAGVLVRIALGSYRAVQESGFIGAGRIAAIAVLTYGMLRRGLFSPQAQVRTLGL